MTLDLHDGCRLVTVGKVLTFIGTRKPGRRMFRELVSENVVEISDAEILRQWRRGEVYLSRDGP